MALRLPSPSPSLFLPGCSTSCAPPGVYNNRQQSNNDGKIKERDREKGLLDYNGFSFLEEKGRRRREGRRSFVCF